jgi:phosphomannomutase
MNREAVIAAACSFRDDDPDEGTRGEAEGLIARAEAGERAGRARSGAGRAGSGSGSGSDEGADSGDIWRELDERFGRSLTFGTAGLRGLIGAGHNRMNRRVVAQTTAALCAYLAGRFPDARSRGICLGYDGRHHSLAFADEVAAVAWGAGFIVYRFDDFAPTPLIAFCVLDRAAVSGIVITASHNPAAYNGYKVYLDDGAQLGTPADREIERERTRIGSVLALPRLTRAQAEAAGLAPSLTGVADRYVAQVAAAVGRDSGTPLPLRAAYTAMHGVGEPLARRVFAAIGALDVHSVAEQATPDPDFPTVAFPNPEEPGALDRVLALGERIGADLAIANDPDADRLAVAARVRTAASPQAAEGSHSDSTSRVERASGADGAPSSLGTLAALSGNELGVLLADHLLSRAPRDGKNVVVSTIVSTPLLERVVRDHGAQCVRTLTGFKWIVGRALQLSREHGLRCVLGFEEALGYCIGDTVRDKDGIAAAAHALHMAELHARTGRTLHDALELLYQRHGLCQSSQVSFTRAGASGLAEIEAAMARLRATPPQTLAGFAVVASLDLAQPPEARASLAQRHAPAAISADGSRAPSVSPLGSSPTSNVLPPGVLFDASELPASDVVALELEGGHRLTVRPSGTEPKLKLYIDVWVKLESQAELAPARARAKALTAQLAAAASAQLGL